ncbi:MAG: YgfZ/GcvT domain-containing protein [Candidatus Kapaibacterium sp.]
MTSMIDSEKSLRRRLAGKHHAAWIDRAGLTVIQLTGSDRIDLLHRLTTNDLRNLQSGNGRQTVLLTDKARIIDVVTLLHDDESTLLIGSPNAGVEILPWVRKYVIMDDVRLKDMSDSFDAIEIIGPRSADIVEQLLQSPVSTFGIAKWARLYLDDGQLLTIVRMPSACEVSYWIIGDKKAIGGVRDHLTNLSDDLPQLSIDDAEYLRVLAGTGMRGHEWTQAYNPLEAGLLHLTSFAKGCYIGQEVVARLDSYNKVKQRIMGLVSREPVAPQDMITADGNTVGVVTSVVTSCDGSAWLALGYIRGEHAHAGTPITIVHDGSSITAELVLPPMLDASCQ